MKAMVSTLLILAPLASSGDPPKPNPLIYIEPQGGFESFITAAFFAKHVPAVVAKDKDNAVFTLKSGTFSTQEERSGLGKLARCAYALCVGIDGSQTVSVELIDATGQIVWAYSVRKIGSVNYQSSAEAIAKHLKEFLEQKPPKAKNGNHQ
jgi:hypothetical protein